MAKRKIKAGCRIVGMQLPALLWGLVEREAASKGLSATRAVVLALAERYNVPLDKLPKLKKTGRPVKVR